jgi:hypothetical protein
MTLVSCSEVASLFNISDRTPRRWKHSEAVEVGTRAAPAASPPLLLPPLPLPTPWERLTAE